MEVMLMATWKHFKNANISDKMLPKKIKFENGKN